MLKVLTWAQDGGVDANGLQHLLIDRAPRPVPMAHSPATGAGLVTNGALGVDVIRLGAGEGFSPHTHPGDHLLIVIAGQGTMSYDGVIYPTRAGQVYMVEGSVPHAVSAITDHVILAVGNPHRAVGDPERATLVEYQEVLSRSEELHCMVCDRRGRTTQLCARCPAQRWPEVDAEVTINDAPRKQ